MCSSVIYVSSFGTESYNPPFFIMIISSDIFSVFDTYTTFLPLILLFFPSISIFTIPWSVTIFVPALKQMFDNIPIVAVDIAVVRVPVVYDVIGDDATVVPPFDVLYIDVIVEPLASILLTTSVINVVKFAIGVCPPATCTNALFIVISPVDSCINVEIFANTVVGDFDSANDIIFVIVAIFTAAAVTNIFDVAI